MVREEKYLGYVIRSDAADDTAMLNVVRGVYSRGNMLIRNFRHCDTNVKIKLFVTFCTNFYCCALWNNFKQGSVHKVKVSYNNVFRALLKLDRRVSMSHIFVILNIPSFPVLQRKLIFSLYKRVLSSDNCLIKTIVNSIHFYNSNLYNYWLSTLFTF